MGYCHVISELVHDLSEEIAYFAMQSTAISISHVTFCLDPNSSEVVLD
jgi:hypothetical protein